MKKYLWLFVISLLFVQTLKASAVAENMTREWCKLLTVDFNKICGDIKCDMPDYKELNKSLHDCLQKTEDAPIVGHDVYTKTCDEIKKYHTDWVSALPNNLNNDAVLSHQQWGDSVINEEKERAIQEITKACRGSGTEYKTSISYINYNVAEFLKQKNMKNNNW